MSDEEEGMNIHGMTDREILILLAKTLPGRVNNHGKRIADLERFRNWAAGAGALGVIVAKAFGVKLTAHQG